MKQEFISINNTIQDYGEYVKNVILLKNYLKNKIKELLFQEEFVLTNNQNNTYHRASLSFYHKETISKRLWLGCGMIIVGSIISWISISN